MHTYEEIYSAIVECIKKCFSNIDKSKLDDPKSEIHNDIGLDSLDLVDIISYMEKKYNIGALDDSDEASKEFSSCKTLDDLTKFFVKSINNKESNNDSRNVSV